MGMQFRWIFQWTDDHSNGGGFDLTLLAMCFQDWRIGRVIRCVPTSITIANGSGISIPQNWSRVGISFGSAQGADAIYVAPDSGVNGSGEGWDPGLTGPLHFTLATHGDLPTHQWGVANNGIASVIFTYFEYFCPEEFLAIGLKEFQGQYGAK